MLRQLIFIGILLLLISCAGKPKVNPEIRQARNEIGALKMELSKLEIRGDSLERKNEQLKKSAEVLETRLGLRQFRPISLKQGRRSWRFNPDKATLIERHGDTGRPVEIQEYVSKFDAYVVAVWATWCKPCTSREELVQLDTLQKALKRSGSTLMGVANDGLDKVLGHERAPSWHYPIWHRDDANIEWLPKAFVQQVGLSLPLFLVVSGNGQVLYWHNSPLTEGVREEIVTAALSHRVRHVLPRSSDDRRKRSKRRRSRRGRR